VDKIELLKNFVVRRHKEGVDLHAIEMEIGKLIAQHGLSVTAETFVNDVLKDLREQEAPRPKTINTIPVWKPERPPEVVSDETEEEEWICTRDLQPFDRREAILDYLDEVGKPQTRSQIEVGAGYRLDNVRLDPDDYDALKRTIQRDLKNLVDKQGILIRETKRNPRHVKGRNDDIVLYGFAPDQNVADQNPPPPSVVGDTVARQRSDISVPETVAQQLCDTVVGDSQEVGMSSLRTWKNS
jgi:hypothetical protein